MSASTGPTSSGARSTATFTSGHGGPCSEFSLIAILLWHAPCHSRGSDLGKSGHAMLLDATGSH